jgi:hypothetical protein
MMTPRQAAPGNWISGLQLGLSLLILAASGVANAQYFFKYDVLPSPTAACNADSVDVGPGDISFNTPPPPNNLVFRVFVNGVAQPPDIQNFGPPFSGTLLNEPFHIAPLGSPSIPYTVVVQTFPAINGTPVGTGIEIRVQCNALGPAAGVASFSAVQAPSAAAVPAIGTQELIALALLLAGAAMWQLRRRRA